MTGREDETTSFDPRTWSDAPIEDAPDSNDLLTKDTVPEKDATSFDPRAWTGDGESAPPPIPPPPPPPSPPATGGKRIALIGGGATIVLAAVAGGAVMLRGGSGPAPTTVASSIPVAATTPVGGADRQVGRRTLSIGGIGEILATLTAAGIAPADAAAANKAASSALGSAPGDIRLEFDLVTSGGTTRLTRLLATRDDGSGIGLTAKPDGGFANERFEAKLKSQIAVVRGEMDGNSFYSSAVAAGVDDSLIDAFANAFSFDFNFATDIAPGDIFEAAFERKINPSGQAVGKPVLLYVSMTTQTKSRALYRFHAPGETESGWFDANGRSTVRALMRTPVDGARITSNFGPRFHPVLRYNRLHGGTDFAAPVGTPIYAAAGGVVISASPSSCAGNMVIIKHDNGWETRYFHLSRYADGVVAGARVEQRITIGDVGNTGKCTTGPHLHYEVHIEGEKVDPMSIDTGSGVSLEGDGLTAFRKERDRIDSSRASQAS